jgi:hypothetical protein
LDLKGNGNAEIRLLQTPIMDAITVNIPDKELALEVDDWSDGQEYDVRIRQVAEGQFEMLTGVPAAAEPEAEEEAPEEEPGEGMYGAAEKGGMMKKKMPASIAILVGKAK